MFTKSNAMPLPWNLFKTFSKKVMLKKKEFFRFAASTFLYRLIERPLPHQHHSKFSKSFFGRYFFWSIHFFVDTFFGPYIFLVHTFFWSIHFLVNTFFGQYIFWSIHFLVNTFVANESGFSCQFITAPPLLIDRKQPCPT